jgi:hypothetical protein
MAISVSFTDWLPNSNFYGVVQDVEWICGKILDSQQNWQSNL